MLSQEFDKIANYMHKKLNASELERSDICHCIQQIRERAKDLEFWEANVAVSTDGLNVATAQIAEKLRKQGVTVGIMPEKSEEIN